MPGKKHWFIPDAYLPSTGQGERWQSHESVCVMNLNHVDSHMTLHFYFEDREPIRNIYVKVDALRCKHIRLDNPEQLAGVCIPRDIPYAIEIEADEHVVVQYSRLDVTQPNFSLMTTIPYCE